MTQTMTAEKDAQVSTPLLETRGCTVRYDLTNEALHPVDIAFAAGSATALIGPSGCGKSTFLRCLNLMNREIPRCRIGGDINYHGQNVNVPATDTYELRKSIGMVFQQPTPFRKSIRENILFAPKRHGITDRAVLDEILETSLKGAAIWDEVKDDLGKSALSLSGGQQQRLCIARTLAMGPDVVLFDEPCSALDPISTFAVEETIRDMVGKGICVVIVTHNMEQAARVSDRTAFFYVGEMVEQGPTKQVFGAPVDKRTCDYLTGRFG